MLSPETRKPGRSLKSTILGWWYISIGLGFLLLAVNRILIADTLWHVAMRLVISAGFFILGYLELTSKLRR